MAQMIRFILTGLALCIASVAVAENEPGWATTSADPAVAMEWAVNSLERSQVPPGFVERQAPSESATAMDAALSLSAAEPSEEITSFGAMSTMSTTGNEADLITPAIAELVTGLRNDPLKIFEYVYNHIEFEPYFGSKKGAHVTLLDGSGNDFDQASLLVAMLRAAGFAPTYGYGPCTFTYEELVDWLGLSATPYGHWNDTQFATYYGVTDTSPSNIARMREWLAVYELLTPNGYFFIDAFHSGGTNFFSIPHVWVDVEVGGVSRQVSPGFKFYETTAGIDLAAAMGYSRTQLLLDAGGTTGAPEWATGLNEVAIAARLETYSENLLDALRNEHHESSVLEIVGGRSILQASFTAWNQVPLVFTDSFAADDWLPFETWSEVPDVHMSKLELRAGLRSAATGEWVTTWVLEELTMPSLRGRKVSLTFDGQTGRLRLDNDLIGAAFAIPSGQASISLGITARHNHYEMVRQGGGYAVVNEGKSDQSEAKPHRVGNDFAHVVAYSFSNPDKLRREREEVLDGYRRDGLPDTDWRVRTELLNLLGLTWYYQTWQQERMVGTQIEALKTYQHRFGRVSQEDGFYIDVGVQFSATLTSGLDFEKADRHNYFTSFFASAMEHGVIEQMQGEGFNGASTVKLIQRTNQLGRRIYRATSASWPAINSELNANFPTADRNRIQDAMNAGGRALVPRNAVIPVDNWSGLGYGIERPGRVEMLISGGLFGGYSTQPGTIASLPIAASLQGDPAYLLSGSTTLRPATTAHTTPQQSSFDPIDMASGAYLLDRTELVLGDGQAPRGLAFTRQYNSNLRYDQSTGLGLGWTHNYAISLTRRSSVKAGLGETISYHAVPFLVGMVAGGDLYSGHTTAKEWVTSALVVAWATDQLSYNAVAVTLGNKTIEFVRMPDGTYVAPANINLTLVENGTTFSLTERHGATMEFDANGRITTITDPHTKVQTFAYSGGYLASVSDAWGRSITFQRNGTSGRIASVSDSTGRTVSFGYTGDDLTACTDVEGKVWTYSYDAEHRMTGLSDPSSRVIATNFYDARSRVNEQWNMGNPAMAWRYYYAGIATIEEDPDGALTRYLYDDRARSIAVVDALGHAESFAYDGHDRRIAHSTRKGETTSFFNNQHNNPFLVLDPSGHGTGFLYDSQLRLETLIDKRGFSTHFTYSPQHQVLTTTNEANEVQTNTYDSDGHLVTTTDAATNTTTLEYDSFGAVDKIIHPGGANRTFTRNALGDVLSETDERGHTSVHTHNARRQVLTSTPPVGAAAQFIYNDQGDLATSIDPRGNATNLTYSATGKLLTLTPPPAAATADVITNTYDLIDRLVTTTNSLGETVSTTHDAVGSPITRTNPLGHARTFTYDANRRATSIADPLNRTTITSYSPRGEVLTTTDPAAEVIQFTYDQIGNRTGLTDRRAETFTFAFDSVNRLTLATTPLGLETDTSYTPAGLLDAITQPAGNTTEFTYDSRLRVIEKSDPVGTIGYTYDAASNLLTVTEGSAAITRTYDARNRPLTATNARGDTISYQWDDANNLTRLTYPDSKEVHYTYNARNQLASVSDWNGRITSYTYDVTGRLESITRHNGTAAQYLYDADGQLIEVRETSGSRLIRYREITYDPAGQITSEFVAPLPRTYTLPAHTATYDADNRIATWNGQPVAVDANGNLTSAPLLGTTHETYTYNARNQLTSAGDLSYTYDAEGNRVGITNTEGTTHFVLESTAAALSRVLMSEAPGGEITHYVYGLGLLYEVRELDEVEESRVHHYNLSGSTIARTDDTGKIVGQAEYSPYGMTVRSVGDIETPFLFNGQYGVITDVNGLLHMRARYYNPHLMRFLNPDPIGFSGGMNWFAFANGNPISLLDPFGLSPTEGNTKGFGHTVLMGVSSGINALSAPLRAILSPAGSQRSTQAMEDTFRMFAPPGVNETPEQFAAGVQHSVSTPEGLIAAGVAFGITKKLPMPSWTTARANYWRDHGVDGQVPHREVLVRDRETGEIYRRTESKELHHVTPRKQGGTHDSGNLQEVWPGQHESIDPYRHVNYDVILVLD